MTNDLLPRVEEHREKRAKGFTSTYNVWKLVYYEVTDDREGAIWREKQIKAGPRRNKVALIKVANPTWRDLYQELIDGA